MVKELSFEQTRKRFSEEEIKWDSTADLKPLMEIIGQNRALRALQFGLKIRKRGFNIYVSGHPGTGRETAIVNFLEELAKSKPTPSDWCYINNFDNLNQPNALILPAGRGLDFQRDMERFVSDMRNSLRPSRVMNMLRDGKKR